MLSDRRQARRYAVSGVAKIILGTGSLPRDCLVTDVSDGGVRLHVEGIEIPDQFTLVFSGADASRRDCRVVWRLGCELGAEFTDRRQFGFGQRVAARGR